MADTLYACWVCGEPADRWNVPEARLCPDCKTAGAGSMRRASFAVAVGGEIIVAAPEHRSPSIQLAFGPEGFGTMVKKLFKKELEIGARQFDDVVYFSQADEEDIGLIRGHAVSALIKSLAVLATVEIHNGHASAKPLPGVDESDWIALLTGSLLHAIFIRQGGQA